MCTHVYQSWADNADVPSRYMQFHPLAYMVKLKIEMSMADLIAKIAKQQNRLPTYNDTAPDLTKRRSRPSHRQDSLLSSFRRGSCQIQPLPPARKAVSFRQWSTTTSEALTSSVPGAATIRNSVEETPVPEKTSAPWNSSSRDLYMLQEVVVETDVVDTSVIGPDGNRQDEVIHNRLVDDPDSRQDAPAGVIWDGSASNSAFVLHTNR